MMPMARTSPDRPTTARSPARLAGALLITVCLLSAASLVRAESNGVFPGAEWERQPAATPRIDVLRAWLRTNPTTAMLVVVGGRVVFEYGDVARVSKVASVRKSILAMLYGPHVAAGTIDLDRTVKELGLDDVQPFLPVEEEATLRHLLLARSGIYLPSGYEALTALSPRRGSQAPGTYFQYQNWDFNAAGAAFEKLTGTDVFDALEADLARPIGMQDFDRARQRKNAMLPDSKYPEYAMYLSTRDMARIGLLMLRGGSWAGREIVPASWVETITTLATPVADIHPTQLGVATGARRWGYGMLWWVWDAPDIPGSVTGPYQGAYTAMGAYGQYITVLPVLDMVVAHKVDFDEDERLGRPIHEVTTWEFDAILQMLIVALP
jgi:CubicO group peptidase (beta-lactamase class C family)